MRFLSAEFLTDDIGGTCEFYTTVLGLPLHMADKNTLDIGAGSSRLLFRRSVNKKPVYHFAFCVPANQIIQAAAFIEQKVPLINYHSKNIVDFDAWNARACYFADNNGNIVELIARNDLQNDAPGNFSPAMITSLSEVAVVTDNVPRLCDKLRDTAGLTNYEKQPPLDNFSVVGDTNGLLIVSEKDRPWFPTEIPAEKFPVKVKIAEGQRFRSIAFNA